MLKSMTLLTKMKHRLSFLESRTSRYIVGIIAGLCLAGLISIWLPLPSDDFSPGSIRSLSIIDRRGFLLREFLNDQQGRGEWISYKDISPWVLKATIAAEDRRFRYHPGVDPIALVRAVAQNISSWRFRSGASTLTQQVIRNVYHHKRSLPAKVLEAWYALRLERMFSKDEIIEQYLNRAPYGNQLFGVEAASRVYFNKPASDLSLSEAALLAALPNAPSSLNPYENLDAARRRQRIILRQMLGCGSITKDEFDMAVEQPAGISPVETAFRAPHVVEMISKQYSKFHDAIQIQSTIDAPLQQEIQSIVRNDLTRLKRKNVTNSAVVVIENKTGEIRVLLGSVDFFNSTIDGQNNGAVALRQPGSALKPFTYAAAFERGLTPASLLADIPTKIQDDRGDYVPENYDRNFHGPVRARTALACSYNVPAVRVLRSIGIEALMQTLESAGITSLSHPADYYGLGLTLGNAEVSLLELTNAYRAIANGGRWEPVRLVHSILTLNHTKIELPKLDIERGISHTVVDEKTAYLITDILRDPIARNPAFGNAMRLPFPCAVKTGTTKDYKDNWTIGYTTEFTLGVWVGNFDASPMRGVSGVSGAGQVFVDIMTSIYSRIPGLSPPDFTIPTGLVQQRICSRSGALPNENCERTILEWFRAAEVPHQKCLIHRRYAGRNNRGIWEEKIFEVYPTEFQEWARAERIPQPPPNAERIVESKKEGYEKTGNQSRLLIVSPGNGEIFKIDPVLRSEYQSIKIIAAVPDNVRDVRLKCDGNELPYNRDGVWWKLEHGTHEFRLEGESRGQLVVSKPVRVRVE